MPQRKQMSLVEVMIMIAVLGIIVSIALPAMKRGARRAGHMVGAPAVGAPAAADGQLNVIEVSDEASKPNRVLPAGWARGVGALLPLILFVAVFAIITLAARRQMSRRAEQ